MRCLLLLMALTGCIGPQLDVVLEGDGEGAVLIDGGVDEFSCSDACATIADGPVLLTAVAKPGSTFVGWAGGGCTGIEPCTVTPASDGTVTARFERTRFELRIVRDGTGTGSITADGIDCGPDCSETLPEGAGILLTASPSADSKFTGWSGGGCAGVSPMCFVTLTEATQIVATFAARNPRLVTVTRSGTGAGRIAAAPIVGIQCGDDCTEYIDSGTEITLAAFAETGSTFTGWTGGGCSGTGPCTTTITAATTIDAGFALVPYSLAVMPFGSGSGTVTSSPAGIQCGSTCGALFPYNTVVTLTATPAAGSVFVGWSGCSGTGTCTVTVDQARTVGAQFKSLSEPFIVSSVSSMTTDTAGGVYTTWIGAWGNVTTNYGGHELGILLPFDEPNTPVVEAQYYYQRTPSPTPSVLAIGPSNGGFIPAQILTVVADTGTLQVYMPSMTTNDCVRTRFYVAADGSTYHSRADHDYTYSAAKANIPTEQCYSTWGVVGPDLTPAQAMVPQHLARAAP